MGKSRVRVVQVDEEHEIGEYVEEEFGLKNGSGTTWLVFVLLQ